MSRTHQLPSARTARHHRNDDTTPATSLLPAGASPSICSPSSGIHALLLAARSGHVAAAEALLKAGAPVDKADAKGYTALVAAAVGGHMPMASLLLQRGANVNACTYEVRRGGVWAPGWAWVQGMYWIAAGQEVVSVLQSQSGAPLCASLCVRASHARASRRGARPLSSTTARLRSSS